VVQASRGLYILHPAADAIESSEGAPSVSAPPAEAIGPSGHNILVLSAGGVGHIALPLLGRPLERQPEWAWGSHPFWLAFAGQLHTPLRQRMVLDILADLEPVSQGKLAIYQGLGWQDVSVSPFLRLLESPYRQYSESPAVDVTFGATTGSTRHRTHLFPFV
jgi:hypothetical protein